MHVSEHRFQKNISEILNSSHLFKVLSENKNERKTNRRRLNHIYYV